MNPGIYYLYEYKNNHCMRNTGFLKLTKKPDCWLLQIQARNIPVTNQHLVPLCAILTEQEHNTYTTGFCHQFNFIHGESAWFFNSTA